MSDIAQQWAYETATGWVLRFPQPAARYSMNDRLHWSRAHAVKEVWRDAAYWWAKSNRLPQNLPPCEIRVTFPVPDRRRRDSDNPAPTVKAIVDGLVLHGCWPDDDPMWVETLGSRFSRDSNVVTVELTRRGDVTL